MTGTAIAGISPFFIVADLAATLDFYRDRLGFRITFEEPPGAPFFAIVQRARAMLMFKGVEVAPLKDTHDGLRGFELKDPDGHVLFFGRPR